MTTPGSPVRDQIAEALFRFDSDSCGGLAGESYEFVADALLPVVARLRAEAAAEALTDAAKAWGEDPDEVGDSFSDARNWLRDRADRIRARP